jgi:hypothetical protein
VSPQTLPAPPRADSHAVARILIGDDDDAMRRLARRILEGCGHEVLTPQTAPLRYLPPVPR